MGHFVRNGVREVPMPEFEQTAEEWAWEKIRAGQIANFDEARIRPIDHNGQRDLAQNVDRVEIAMAQPVAFRVSKTSEQNSLSRFVKDVHPSDVRRQPQL